LGPPANDLRVKPKKKIDVRSVADCVVYLRTSTGKTTWKAKRTMLVMKMSWTAGRAMVGMADRPDVVLDRPDNDQGSCP